MESAGPGVWVGTPVPTDFSTSSDHPSADRPIISPPRGGLTAWPRAWKKVFRSGFLPYIIIIYIYISYTARVSFKHENTAGAGYLALDLNSPQLLTEFVSVHWNRPRPATSATSILPQLLLSWWGSNWAPFAHVVRGTAYYFLVLESNLYLLDSPILIC